MKKNNEKQQVAEIMNRLYQRHLTNCMSGNVSLKNDDGHIFITPSQIDKNSITKKQIIELDSEGNYLAAKQGVHNSKTLKASMETRMHLLIYQQRSDIKAIIHAHPLNATAWACSKQELTNNLCTDAIYYIGNIVRIPYSLMGSEMLAKNVSQYLVESNAALLNNHGVVTIGTNLFQAYYRMELIEYLAELHNKVLQIGSPLLLDNDIINQILNNTH